MVRCRFQPWPPAAGPSVAQRGRHCARCRRSAKWCASAALEAPLQANVPDTRCPATTARPSAAPRAGRRRLVWRCVGDRSFEIVLQVGKASGLLRELAQRAPVEQARLSRKPTAALEVGEDCGVACGGVDECRVRLVLWALEIISRCVDSRGADPQDGLPRGWRCCSRRWGVARLHGSESQPHRACDEAAECVGDFGAHDGERPTVELRPQMASPRRDRQAVVGVEIEGLAPAEEASRGGQTLAAPWLLPVPNDQSPRRFKRFCWGRWLTTEDRRLVYSRRPAATSTSVAS